MDRLLDQDPRFARGQIETHQRSHESELAGPIGVGVLAQKGVRVVLGVREATGHPDPQIDDSGNIVSEGRNAFDPRVLDLVEVAGWRLGQLAVIADTEKAQDLEARSVGASPNKQG